jgi:hypothetical protein
MQPKSPFIRCWGGSDAGVSPLSADADPFVLGLTYLQEVEPLGLEPGMVNVIAEVSDRVSICTWVGHHIGTINAQLDEYLNACQDCFHSPDRPAVRVLAAPLTQSFGIDGVCNIHLHPMTILIDVGRVTPANWFGLVMHEYAHAYTGHPGHTPEFAEALTHLCLGLGWPVPIAAEASLSQWPHCARTSDPLGFWRGDREIAINGDRTLLFP